MARFDHTLKVKQEALLMVEMGTDGEEAATPGRSSGEGCRWSRWGRGGGGAV